MGAGKTPGTGPGGEREIEGKRYSDPTNQTILAPTKRLEPHEGKTTERIMMRMEEDSEMKKTRNGRMEVMRRRMVEVPRNGRLSANLKKCLKGSSSKNKTKFMKMVGGPKSFSGKDGKGRWETDSSQKKIDSYFKGIGATSGRDSHGNFKPHKY